MRRAGFSYANLSVDGHRELFLRAGFTDVQVIEDYEKVRFAALAKNPEPFSDHFA